MSADLINPVDCYPPYDEIIPLLRDSMDIPDIVSKVGYTSVRTAMDAAEHVNGEMKPLQWLDLLKKSASKATSASQLKKLVKDLEDDKDVDLAVALKAVNLIDENLRDLTPMSEVKPEDNIWIPTGWEPIDACVGGLVKAGLVTIGASPGVGKTTLLIKLASKMVHKYKKKKVAIFTLEMTNAQIAQRTIDIDDSLTDDDKARILLGDGSFSIEEIYTIASKYAATEKLAMIGVDFADLIINGEQTEATMSTIYRTLASLAKKIDVPVVLISQLNRNTYNGGTPKVNHLRYSGMAEAMSGLILMIHNPHTILADYSAKSELDDIPGRGYLIVGKSRFGYKKGKPGAIMIEWEGEVGWGDKHLGYFDLNA